MLVLLHNLDLQLETDIKVRARTKQIISIFQLRPFHLFIATLRQHLDMEYISLS